MRISDWSSDVCSSDLIAGRHDHAERGRRKPGRFGIYSRTASDETNGSPRRDRTGGRVSPFRPVELHDGESDDRRWRNLRPVGVMATRTVIVSTPGWIPAQVPEEADPAGSIFRGGRLRKDKRRVGK